MSALTPSQAAAASSPGSVAITAGAGSGKTHVLAERVIGLLERGIDPAQLAAVTFTEAAASELRARVESYAAERYHGSDGDPAARERWAAVRDSLPAAQISTIHSLCARIAREHPLESGAGLGFETLDETGGAVWTRAVLREIFQSLPDAAFDLMPAQTVFAAIQQLLDDPDASSRAFQTVLGKSVLVEAALGNDQRPDPLARWQHECDLERLTAWAHLRPEWDTALAVLAGYAATDPADKLETARRTVLSAARAVGRDDPLPGLSELAAALSATYRGNIGAAPKWKNGGLLEARAALAELKRITADERLNLCTGPADEWLARTLPALREAFELTLAGLDAAKAEAEVVSFADQLRHAARALEHPHVRAYYQARWTAVLVDEFQDTSPLQWRVLGALAGNANLTVVGDEKQSIYGFTGASLRLFADARARVLETGGIEVSLDTSFRTHSRLVEATNHTFERLFASGPTAFAPLIAHRPDNPAGTLEPVELLLVSDDADIGTLRQAEARLIARRARDLIESGRPVVDRRTGRTRPVRAGDIAVLFRARTDLQLYEEALAAAGVPYVSGSTGLLGRREIADARALLAWLENPADDLSLAAVLRGPFFARPDDDLLDASEARGPRERLWAGVQNVATDEHGLTFARRTLEELLTLRHRLTPDGLLIEADARTGFTAVLAQLAEGRRRVANVERFTALLREWRAAGDGDLSGVRARLADLDSLEAGLPEAALADEDAVRLMTMHGAKGLEFPVVVLADLARLGRAPGPGQLLVDADLGVALKLPDEEAEDREPVLWRRLSRAREDRDDAETDRLLYVGFTRARDLLILTSGHKVPKNPPKRPSKLEILRDCLPPDGVLRLAYAISDIASITAAAAPSERMKLDPALGPVRLLPDHLPVTAVATYLECPQRFRFRHLDGLEPLERGWRWPAGPETPEREPGTGAAAVGSLVHLALERRLSGVEQLTRNFPTLLPSVLAEAAELVAAAERLVPLGASAEREGAFDLELGPVRLEGVVDAFDRDTAWVVDYKTDRRMNPEHHLPQLALYARARGATRASLAYLRHGILHDFGPADLERGLGLAHVAVEAMQAGEFAARPSAFTCKWCEYRLDCPEADLGGGAGS